MKIWLSILYSSMLLLCSNQSTLVWKDYYVNQDFYEMHCENKSKPELECHGKCQVTKPENQKPQSQLLLICCGFSFTKPIQVQLSVEKRVYPISTKMIEVTTPPYQSPTAKLLDEPPIVG